MEIEELQERVNDGNYLVKSHAVQHALKEGFTRQHIVDAILAGKIIEVYPEDQRVLINGTVLIDNVSVYLHIVCEYADAFYVEIITAYIPDPICWGDPPLKRRQ